LRRYAQEKGFKLSEYGLYRQGKIVAGRAEKEIYKCLGMDYIEPELRENTGEIEAARVKKLPKLIGYEDLQGDLHCHSDWDGVIILLKKLRKARKSVVTIMWALPIILNFYALKMV